MSRQLPLYCLLLALLTITSRADANDLSGTWTASSLRVSWSIGDWGEACGPRPRGGGERGGTVTLTPSGSGFKLNGLGRNYSTSQCWERMPGLSTRSKSAGSSAITATCKMPAGDPRQAKVVTSWYPRGDKIYFDETGQYQFVTKGNNCTASVRRTRVLTRVVKKTEKEKPKEEVAKETAKAEEKKPEKKPAAAPPPPPERSAQCKTPGEATVVEVSPKSKLMRQGESFTFQSIARDKNGCRVPLKTKWSLISGTQGKASAERNPDHSRRRKERHVATSGANRRQDDSGQRQGRQQ